MATQLLFDFYKPAVSLSQRKLHDEFSRCAVKWFLENRAPDGYGVNIPTRISNIKSDAAFFWTKARRDNGAGSQLLVPARTAVMICAISLDQCWVNCGNYEQSMSEMVRYRHQMDRLEAEIRCQEPDLREDGALFEEFAVWDYSRSTNREYQKVRSQYNQIEKNLYKGSRFERIASAKVADELYLAVPSGLINSEQVFRQWGILEIKRNREVRLVREPMSQVTSLEARNHLVQNIAIGNSEAVNFALGLRHSLKDDRIVITKRPRRSCREETSYLE